MTSSHSAALPDATDAADAPHAPEVAEPARGGKELTMYRDPATGVSFQFPAVWRPAVAGQSPISPQFESVAGKARITQEFLPKGTAFESTVLRALMFSYTVKSRVSERVCAGLAQKAAPGATATANANYGGRTFAEATGADAAMCTQVKSWVDTAMDGGRCMVFERDFVTTCPDIKTNTTPRSLTREEIAALEGSLNAVMGSVRLASK